VRLNVKFAPVFEAKGFPLPRNEPVLLALA
jgi:hypothetical protein